jgi:hypothetical protein
MTATRTGAARQWHLFQTRPADAAILSGPISEKVTFDLAITSFSIESTDQNEHDNLVPERAIL